MKFQGPKLAVLLIMVALVSGACRNSDGGGDVSAGGEGNSAAGKLTTDIGITPEACPDAVNKEHGCIYLGTISDLTKGPFAPLAVPVTEAQKAFWTKVNQAGGIGDFDVNVTSFVRDNEYKPDVHKAKYDEIKGKVLALAQTLGSPTTSAILNDLKGEKVVSAPASWTSAWAFEDVILESGTNYCMEAMNSVDYAVDEKQIKSVMAVHYPGDYGGDAAAGAKIAAERSKLPFTDVQTTQGQENQSEAISRVVSAKPDLVILTTGPTEAAVIVGQAAARGYKGTFIGTSPTWNPGLLKSPAAPAIQAQYLQSGPWAPWGADTPGHKAMREALGPAFTPNDGATAGWAWSYPLKAALEQAFKDGDLTRAGVFKAAAELEKVDYEGMLPDEAGRFAAEPSDGVFRKSVISKPDPAAPTGVTLVKEFFVGDTARDFEFTKPCFA
jgi:ABC-type branched-subunit amino acid transport system substrate-binding protein